MSWMDIDNMRLGAITLSVCFEMVLSECSPRLYSMGKIRIDIIQECTDKDGACSATMVVCSDHHYSTGVRHTAVG